MSKSVIYIVNTNKSKAAVLRRYLLAQFPDQLRVFIFFNNRDCMRVLHPGVDMVIDDNVVQQSSPVAPEPSVLRKKLELFPNIKLIMYTSQKEVSDAVAQMQFDKLQKPRTRKRNYSMAHLFEAGISQPIRVLYAEFGVVKFVSIFLLTFVTMAVIVIAIVHAINTPN